MTPDTPLAIGTLAMIYIFILAIFTGVEVISRVPTVLHTPLMSGANAIHGIVLVGGIILFGTAGDNRVLCVLGFIAVILGTLNVVGGFVVTDRMLEMFKAKPTNKSNQDK
jgi:NAD(P) transhydrogenase subunit alpha